MKEKLQHALNKLEQDLISHYQSKASNEVALEILKAKDPFLAAAIMQQHQLYYGRGDFKSIVETLIQKHPQNAQFKELGLKLGMIKHGYISKEILDEKKNDKPENAVKLHNDSDGQGGRIKRPNVHKIFQTHCYEGQTVSQEEMDKLFPEYKEEMEIWRLQ